MFTVFKMETVRIFGCSNMRYLDIDQKKEFDVILTGIYLFSSNIFTLL